MISRAHPVVSLLCAGLFCLLDASAWGGGIFVTGHDPDFHAFQGGNTAGAQHIITSALAFVTNNKPGSILLVTDLINPGAGYSDPRLGLTAAGLTFDVADNGSAGGSVKDLHTVNFSNYSAIVVASDFGGWLRQSELDILIARESQLFNYLNSGGGLVAFAESGPPSPGLLTHDAFGYLPFLVTSAQKNENEVGNTLTAFGAGLGLTNADVNGNASHNVFTATGGMNVVDNDSQGQILSLAFFGPIGPGGVAPEPSSLLLAIVGGVVLTPFLLRRRSLRVGGRDTVGVCRSSG
jgi:hypothetical protein